MSGHKRYKGMSHEHNPTIEPSQIQVYQIRIKGHLGADWTGWFDGLAITLQDNGETLLTGPVVDQAALHGLLRKVRDLGMVLLSVMCMQSDQADAIASRCAAEKGDPPLRQC
jgi:hypothetical protein